MAKELEAGRPTWSRPIEFTLAGIGCAVGLGNIWRFPYLCYRSGGGVGMATVAISFIMSTYYNVIITWALYYLFSSFQSQLPWQSCNNTWNRANCTDHATINSTSTSTASQQFFNYRVLERTGGVEEPGTMRWELFLLLLLAWLLVYFCIFKGVKSTGKVVYFTALFPYVILVALLINNVQLPGAKSGIWFFIVPEWEKLLSVEVWINAAAQIFNSIGIGFGSLMAMASYNTFNNSVLKDTLAIAITNSLTSILSGFVIFSALGYMSYLQNIPVSEIAVDGPGLVFVVYPQAFASMPVAPMWAVFFFFMLLCLGLDSQFAMVEVMVTSLMDGYSTRLLRFFRREELLVLAVCATAFLLGIPNVMQVGIYVFQLMDHYTAIVSIMFLAFFEVVAICWLYGVKRLSSNVEEMMGRKPGIFLRLCWLVICPVLITVILVFSVIQFTPARYENYVYPAWAQGIGWVIAMASIIWIPLAALHTLWVLPGSLTEVINQPIQHHPPSHLSFTHAIHPFIFPSGPIQSNHSCVPSLSRPATYRCICTSYFALFPRFFQKLWQSIRPFALDEASLSLCCLQKRGVVEVNPNLVQISSITPLPENNPVHTSL
ncbi:sodium- and chloride-dependent GABA transporter ine isoform X2 [Brachyhypopomus gauderio]|uniref:sodium- and chloride-dependent GABA transporter ine isoform X2 n=1 Tax=Brachyhypopomus gauderio TaxID=698409 RepID=UPI0040424101